MTTVLDPAPPTPPRPSDRRRAWLRTAVIGLAALVYLVSWTVYSLARTGDDRYRALEPGRTATVRGVEWRLLSLVQTTQLAASSGEPGYAGAGATYVVAQLERTPAATSDFAVCTTALLGPDGRIWEPGGYGPEFPIRDAPTCGSQDRVVGQTYRFEVVYLVPTAFVDGVVGVALPDRSNADRTPVLRQPA